MRMRHTFENRRNRVGLAAATLAVVTACAGPQDDPTNVHDLRVLAARSEPPEYMLEACPAIDPSTADQNAIIAALTKLAEDYLAAAPAYKVSALVADPQGGGRTLQYDWIACVDTPDSADVICTDQSPSDVLGSSQGPAGVVTTTFTPSTDLLTAAFETYQGLVLFGVRFMVTLRVKTLDGTEVLTGGKRVQLSCQLVPGQTAATNPAFTDISLDGQTWDPAGKPVVGGTTGHTVTPADPTSLEQTYVMPTYTGGSQQLTESWMYTFIATAGHFDNFETGGTDFQGQPVPIENTWGALSTDPEQDVTFYFLVRNGRGGEAWTTRQAHLVPSQ